MTTQETTSTTVSSGTPILGLLGIVFVTLKLCGVIDWSWWYVTLPFWGGLALVASVGIIALVIWGFVNLVNYFTRKAR